MWLSNLFTLIVTDEGNFIHVIDEGDFRHVTDEDYFRHVTDEGYFRHVTDECYLRHVTNEGYCINASCALNLISTVLLLKFIHFISSSAYTEFHIFFLLAFEGNKS
jgi:hypothetical protein